MLETITTPTGQRPFGPYAQAIRANGFIFCSGHSGVDPVTDTLVPGGITQQTRQVLANLRAVLLAAGSDLAHVVKVTVYLHDMADFAQMNEVYAEEFGSHQPARTAIEVAQLAKPGAVVVMDLIAVLVQED